MKKVVALALALGMTIGMTACAKPADSGKESPEESITESFEEEILGIQFESRNMKTDGLHKENTCLLLWAFYPTISRNI